MINIIKILSEENKNIPMIVLHIFCILLSIFFIFLSFQWGIIPGWLELISAIYMGMSITTFLIFTIYILS